MVAECAHTLPEKRSHASVDHILKMNAKIVCTCKLMLVCDLSSYSWMLSNLVVFFILWSLNLIDHLDSLSSAGHFPLVDLVANEKLGHQNSSQGFFQKLGLCLVIFFI